MQDNKYTEVQFAPVKRRGSTVAVRMVTKYGCSDVDNTMGIRLVWFSSVVALQLLNTPLKWQEKTTLCGLEATMCGETQRDPRQLQLTPSPGSALVRRRQVDKRGRVTEVGSKVGQQRLCLALSVWRCGFTPVDTIMAPMLSCFTR